MALTFSTLNSGLSLDLMASWHSAFISALLPGCPRGTTKSTSCSGPPPGEGTPTAATSCTAGTPSAQALSSSTELTCTRTQHCC